MRSPFDEYIFTVNELSDLADAIKKFANAPTLKEIAENRAALQEKIFIPIFLDQKQELVLAKSAETNREHALLYAVFLYFKIQNNPRSIQTNAYEKVLEKLVKEGNNLDALYLLVEARVGSRDPLKKKLSAQGLTILSKDSFYGPLVEAKFLDLMSLNEKPKEIKHETTFTKSPPAAHPAIQVDKENAKIFCELIAAIIKHAKENKVSAKLFEKFENAYKCNQDNQGPKYKEIINELILNTQKTSTVKSVKKFINVSEQTTPQSKTIVHAIKLYGEGDHKGAVKVLNDYHNYGKIPEIRAKEQVQPLQQVQKK